MKLKAFVLLMLIVLMSVPAALATDPEPTVLTNKDAIDLVRSNLLVGAVLATLTLLLFLRSARSVGSPRPSTRPAWRGPRG